MTAAAIRQAFDDLRPAEEFARLEEAARSRSEADWIVGMNATRAATIRLRSSFDGAVSLGRVQTPTLAIVARREEEIRAFKPEPYWLVDAVFEPPGGRARRGATRAATTPARSRDCDRRGGRGDRRRRARRRPARSPSSRQTTQEGARAAALRPHLAAARGQHALRLLRPPHARRRPAPLRGAQGAHLSAHELALPDRRHGRRDQADRRAGRASGASTRSAAALRDRARHAAARPRGQRREGHRPPRDHPDAAPSTRSTR